MHRRLPVIVLCCSTIQLAAQDVYFKDDFSDNANAWAFPSDDCSIADGNYVIDNQGDGALAAWQTVDMPQYGNYSIRIATRHLSGTEDWGYGLIFGASDFTNCFIFEIASGSYRIREILNDSSSNIVEWTDDANIWKSAENWNSLRMDCFDQKWSFYANGHLLISRPQSLTYGTKAGLFLTHAQHVLFDDFVVKPAGGWSTKDPSDMEVLTLPEAVRKMLGFGDEGFSSVIGDDKGNGMFTTRYNVDGAYLASISTSSGDTNWVVPLDLETSWYSASSRLDARATEITGCSSSYTFYELASDQLLFPFVYAGSLRLGDSIQAPRIWLQAESLHASVDSALISAIVSQRPSPVWFHVLAGEADASSPLARSMQEIFAEFPKGFDDWKGPKTSDGIWTEWECTHPFPNALTTLVQSNSLAPKDGLACVMSKSATETEARAKLDELLAKVRAALGAGYYEAYHLSGNEPEYEFRKFGASGVTEPVVNAFIVEEGGSYSVDLFFRAKGLMF